MRRAYSDRAEYLGDPAFVKMPIARLTSKPYAKRLRADISDHAATASAMLRPLVTLPKAAGENTTHFSILDHEGNRVAATVSLNTPFGSAFMPVGTGVLLNNTMDDFVAAPGVPNAYGLVGGVANAIAPGKRPLSSMTPAFLETKDRVAILGSKGGSRIISQVLLAALDFAAGRYPEFWVSAPRYHHQYLPDVLQAERDALTDIEYAALKKIGHNIEILDSRYGNMHAILWDKHTGRVSAASDPRGEGAAIVVPFIEPQK
jgi:gamma-glutamyltranspeptidase/glutathione hydrolase